ncbi:MAG: hypothetical protein KF688_18090 [Pirellulales bacterium]|nr:hypothetical protein [Pirellulales bacterium]
MDHERYKRIEAGMIHRVGVVETAIVAGQPIPPQDGNWRIGDLMILVTVACKVMRDYKGDPDEYGIEGFIRGLAE